MARHVGIVGAGFSGLRAAAVLLENGFEVTILEARDRIGGRVAQSDEMGPLPVDIGANWVHSTGDNPIVKLAKETETSLHLWAETTLMVDKQGNLLDPKHADEALKAVWVILVKAIEYSKSSSESINSSASLYDFFLNESQNMVKAGDISSEIAGTVLSMSEMWGAYVGAPVNRQSLKFFFLEDCIHGDDCFIPSNYQKIVAKAAAPALKGATISYKKTVTSIKADGNSESASRVEVQTADGDNYKFDAVLNTTPLGWLKRHKTSITPMPERLSRAIDSISYGNLEKVLIEFPSAFWQPEGTPDYDRTSFVHWLSPEYALNTNPKSWRLECVLFSAFPEQYRRNIILFYTFGECARHVANMVSGKTGGERSTILQNFFEPYYSRLPGYQAATCEPLRFLATEWCNDELAGFGSYCDFQVGMTDAAADVLAIRHGIPEHHIYFAGEHTAPFDGLGTAAGAYNSGDHVAHRIVKDLQ